MAYPIFASRAFLVCYIALLVSGRMSSSFLKKVKKLCDIFPEIIITFGDVLLPSRSSPSRISKNRQSTVSIYVDEEKYYKVVELILK